MNDYDEFNEMLISRQAACWLLILADFTFNGEAKDECANDAVIEIVARNTKNAIQVFRMKVNVLLTFSVFSD